MSQWSRDSCSLKEFMLWSIKSLFLIFVTTSRSFSFVSCIEKNNGKWSETSDLTIPLFRESLNMSVVKMWSIRPAQCSDIWVGQFIIRMEPFSKIL